MSDEEIKKKIDELIAQTKHVRSLVESLNSSNPVPPKRLLSVSEAAEYLGIGKTEAYAHLRKYVRAINHGKKILIPKEELDSLIERTKRTGNLFS